METYTSDANDAELWRLGVLIVDELRSMTFDPVSEASGRIAAAGIVLRKNPAIPAEDFTESEIKPGLLVVIGNDYASPWNQGTNEAEDLYYQILIQVINVDHGDRLRCLRTHLKWMSQIKNRMNQSSLVDSLTGVTLGHAAQVTTLDEKQWRRHGNFVGGVMTRWLSREDNDNE